MLQRLNNDDDDVYSAFESTLNSPIVSYRMTMTPERRTTRL